MWWISGGGSRSVGLFFIQDIPRAKGEQVEQLINLSAMICTKNVGSYSVPRHGEIIIRTPSLFYLGQQKTPDPNPSPNPETQTPWSDQCLDAVAGEGSRFIRPPWMPCLEILNVDWTLIGPLGMLWGKLWGTAVYN